MWKVTKNHFLAINYFGTDCFEKIGTTWYAQISSGHFKALSKEEGFLIDFWLMNNFLLKNGTKVFKTDKLLLSLVEIGKTWNQNGSVN